MSLNCGAPSLGLLLKLYVKQGRVVKFNSESRSAACISNISPYPFLLGPELCVKLIRHISSIGHGRIGREDLGLWASGAKEVRNISEKFVLRPLIYRYFSLKRRNGILGRVGVKDRAMRAPEPVSPTLC